MKPHEDSLEAARQSAMDQAGCGGCCLDSEGRVVSAEAGARRLLGVAGETCLEGMPLAGLLGAREAVGRLIQEATRDGSASRAAFSFHPMGAEGSRTVALHLRACGDGLLYLFLRDVSAAMEKTVRIEHVNSMLRAVREINKIIVSAEDERALARGVCEALVQTRGYRNAWLALLDGTGGLSFVAQAGASEPPSPGRSGADESAPCLRLALEHPDPVAVTDDPGLCADCAFRGSGESGSALVARLQQEERVHGVLHIAMPRSLAEDPEEQALFEETAGEIALALHSMRLADERRRHEEVIRQSHVRLTSTLESLTEGFIALDPGLTVMYLNAAGESLLMRRREDVEGRPFLEAFPEVRGSELERRFQEAARTRQPVFFETLVELAPYSNWYSIRIYPGELGYSVFFSVTTDVRRMEADLLRSQELFHTFMDQLPVTAFIKDGRDLKLRYVNAFMAERFGSSDWIGKSADDYYGDQVARRALDHDRLALETGPTVYEEWVPDKGGQWRFLRTHKFPVRLAGGERLLGGLAVDLTEIRQTQEALAASEDRFRSLFTSMLDGVVLHEVIAGDPPGLRFVDFNPAFQAMLGGPERIPLGALASELRERGIDYPAERIIGAAADGSDRFDTDLGLPGRTFRILAFAPGGGRVACIISDISEAVRLQQERERFEARARQAQKLESLGVLAGGIAHDFNNLLMGILGNVELAALDAQSDQQRAHLKDIERASHHAADLCRQMLAYSGQGKLVIQQIGLSDLVGETRRLLSPALSKEARVIEELSPNVPDMRGDATQIRQVVMNLITNASDALEGEPGRIYLRTGAVELTAPELAGTYLHDDLPGGRYVYAEVEDTGCGLSQDLLPRVFEPFFSTKFMGRGLGMSAVIGIVRGHHGAIDLDSVPNEGTRIRVLFPAYAQEAAPGGDALELPEDQLEKTLRVLVIDDDPMVLKLATRMLQSAGVEPLTAQSGDAALELLNGTGEATDAVVLDRAMPGMSGEEVFRRIRERRPGMPVVVSSGFAEEETLRYFEASEKTSFLQKPYQTRQLLDAIQKALEAGS